MADVLELLAEAVRSQWTEEARIRRLNDPHPLPVSWVAAQSDLVDDWATVDPSARNRRPRRASALVSPEELHGRDDELYPLFDRLAARRLVILGRPGSGKTILLVRFVLDMLAERASGGPVPFLIPAASWNPAQRELRQHLAMRLIDYYPALGELAVPGDRISRAEALLNQGLVIPILDGLDEIPEQVRGQAIAAINRWLQPQDAIIVSCRSDEYASVVHSDYGEYVTLRRAAGIELQSLDPEVVKSYLKEDAGGSRAVQRWEPVFAALESTPTDQPAPVALALRTPLMVSLARTVYNPRPGEDITVIRAPRELCDRSAFPTKEAVEHHLFDAFVPAAYRADSDPGRFPAVPPAAARQWLTALAVHLERDDGVDLAWWNLRRSTPGWLPAAVVGSICGLAAGVAAALGTQVGQGLGMGLGTGILVGFLVAASVRRRGVPVRRSRTAIGLGIGGGVLGGLLAGLSGEVGVGQTGGITNGIPVGLAIGIVLGPAHGVLGGLLGSLVGGYVAGLVGPGGSGLLAAVVNGVGVGVGAGLIVARTGQRRPARVLRWSPVGLMAGLIVGIAIGWAAWRVADEPALGLVLALLAGLSTAFAVGMAGEGADLTAADPDTLLGRDARIFRYYFLAAVVAAGLVGMLSLGFVAAQESNLAPTLPVVVRLGLPVGVAAAIIVGLTSAFMQASWGAFRISAAWLALRGRLPLRIMRFLRDAHERRGVLRQVGGVYQFRHIELQRRLASHDQHRDDHPRAEDRHRGRPDLAELDGRDGGPAARRPG